MPRIVAFICYIVVAVAFGIAAIGKIGWPHETQAALVCSGMSESLAPAIVTTVSSFELAIAIAMLLGWRSRLLFIMTFAMLAIFCVFLLILSKVDPSGKCACFGPLMPAWASGGTAMGIARNCLLGMLLLYPAIQMWRNTRVLRPT